MMDILETLKLNMTMFSHIAIFLVAYIALYFLLFQPYLKRFEKREESTFGQENQAEAIDVKTQGLQIQFVELQKRLNTEVQAKYNASKLAGENEAKIIIDKARTENENYLAQAGQKISQEVAAAKQAFQAEVPKISNNIVEKLVGRNI